MEKGKYSTVLTIILIILIVAIIATVSIMTVKVYKNYQNNKESQRVISELKQEEQEEKTEENNDEDKEENTVKQWGNADEIISNKNNESGNNSTSSGNIQTQKKIKKYNGYPMIGYIKIPKTKAEYPILLDVSSSALEVSVGLMYPTNGELNKPGNVVIIGHNYRNGKFFSNNKKLATGDKIEITDLEGKTLTYTIYEIFETSPNDTGYITRDRGNNIEISLSTCTDDGQNRLIILARVE